MAFSSRGPSLRSAIAAGMLVLGSFAAPQQKQITLVEPPAPLLPTDAHFIAVNELAQLPADAPQAATVLKEDALVRREARLLAVPTASSPANSGWVEAYQFDDATGALAAYTYFRLGGRHRDGPIATLYELPNGNLVFLSGVSVVRANIRQHGDSVDALLAQLERGLPKTGGRKSLAPLLPTLLPATGLDPNGMRYALGPVSYQAEGGVLPPDDLGWDKSLETATASYTGKSGKGTLTLLLYPTPQIAGDRGRVIEKLVNEKGPAAFGTVKMRRVGPLVGITSGGFTPEQAQALVDSLHLNEEVSFDQKMPLEFHAEVRKTASLLENIAVLCGVLVLAAILLSLFLGGARAGIRVMLGKPAATEPEFLTINLRDKPKALFNRKGPGAQESDREAGF